MGLMKLTGMDKLLYFFRMVKELGGWHAVMRKRYLTDETRVGTLVGEDKYGNKYYENNAYFMPRNRWVEYPVGQWLDYDPSQIPANWYGWLHHQTDKPPKEEKKYKWQLDHEENLTLFPERKCIPYPTTREKIIGWEPTKKKQ
ncbi:hypothetical protein AB6A40_000510 [Gnathostoma spinigerum]|uniref:NADH dehydrogenase [ubiquinone] 1 alpha subcomplex subunit 12 n=1 Tax=Gnathostoma spinigerum TaxID=75299 RepID=A0ABD6E499_9BILA